MDEDGKGSRQHVNLRYITSGTVTENKGIL